MHPLLDERQRRLFAATEAATIGRGGIARVMAATGLARGTIAAGVRDLAAPRDQRPARTRRPGAGRKPLRDHDGALVADLKNLLAGDPARPPSLRTLAAALAERGHRIGHASVAKLIREAGLNRTRPSPNAASRPRVARPQRSAPVSAMHARPPPEPPAVITAQRVRARAAPVAVHDDRPHRDLIAGLAKGLAMIDAFDHRRPRLTISEAATVCGLTRAAARRYLKTLAWLGYVEEHHGMFALTAKVVRLGQSFMLSSRLPQIIQPELLAVAAALQEASSAGVLDGNDVISIAATTAARRVSLTIQPGTRVPAYCTSNGRVLVGAGSADAIRAWVARQRLVPLTAFTITSAERLFDEIVRARDQGYAVVDQEFEMGLRTIAVPLVDHRGETIASINVSAHVSRATSAQLVERCLPTLRAAQARLRTIL